jgi:hypothetical protein
MNANIWRHRIRLGRVLSKGRRLSNPASVNFRPTLKFFKERPIGNEEGVVFAFGKEVVKMPIDPISGYSAIDQMSYSTSDQYSLEQSSQVQQAQDSTTMDRQTFGAAVVEKTLDYLNGQGSSGMDMAPVDKQTFGAAVVSKTLDYMNAGQGSDNSMAQSYDFQKSVLGGHADALGAIANIKV